MSDARDRAQRIVDAGVKGDDQAAIVHAVQTAVLALDRKMSVSELGRALRYARSKLYVDGLLRGPQASRVTEHAAPDVAMGQRIVVRVEPRNRPSEDVAGAFVFWNQRSGKCRIVDDTGTMRIGEFVEAV